MRVALLIAADVAEVPVEDLVIELATVGLVFRIEDVLDDEFLRRHLFRQAEIDEVEVIPPALIQLFAVRAAAFHGLDEDLGLGVVLGAIFGGNEAVVEVHVDAVDLAVLEWRGDAGRGHVVEGDAFGHGELHRTFCDRVGPDLGVIHPLTRRRLDLLADEGTAVEKVTFHDGVLAHLRLL